MGLVKILVTCIHFSLTFLRLQQIELSVCSQAKNLCNNLCRFVQIKIKITDYIRFQDCKKHELSYLHNSTLM